MAMVPRRALRLGGGRGGGGGPALRAASTVTGGARGVPRQATTATAALFSTGPAAAPSRFPSPSRPRAATSPLQRQAVAAAAAAAGRGVRWSSDSAPAGSKIWSFEEIQNLTTTSSSSSSSKPKVTIIDVREPGELAQTGRIPGSVNVPITSAPDSFHIGADEFADRFGFERPDPRGDEVLFYCKAGVRSRAAAGIARDAGWRNVGEYPGSWVDWVGKGGKVER